VSIDSTADAVSRFPIGFQIIFAIILIAGVLAFPESPRWLMKHGYRETAAELMARFHETTPDDEQVKADIAEIDKINALTEGSKLSWKEFLSNGKEMNLWRTGVACASQACQQISGINLVTYYATTVFGEQPKKNLVGMTDEPPQRPIYNSTELCPGF